MKCLTYEALRRDPKLLQALVQQARRERSEAVYQLVIAPVLRLFRAKPARRATPAAALSAKPC